MASKAGQGRFRAGRGDGEEIRQAVSSRRSQSKDPLGRRIRVFDSHLCAHGVQVPSTKDHWLDDFDDFIANPIPVPVYVTQMTSMGRVLRSHFDPASPADPVLGF